MHNIFGIIFFAQVSVPYIWSILRTYLLTYHTKENIIRQHVCFSVNDKCFHGAVCKCVSVSHNDKEANGYNNNINGPDDADDARLSG